MYCENCGKNYANVRYTQIINGNKKEMFLCDECSKILGLGSFNMQMDFSTFLGDFLEDFEEENIIPQLINKKELECERCKYTFEQFINTGRFGCPECYSTFEEKISPLLKRIQGADRHVGRLGNIEENYNRKEETEGETIKETAKLGQINELKKELRLAIKEEKYEEAAKIRDKIKELEGEK